MKIRVVIKFWEGPGTLGGKRRLKINWSKNVLKNNRIMINILENSISRWILPFSSKVSSQWLFTKLEDCSSIQTLLQNIYCSIVQWGLLFSNEISRHLIDVAFEPANKKRGKYAARDIFHLNEIKSYLNSKLSEKLRRWIRSSWNQPFKVNAISYHCFYDKRRNEKYSLFCI